VFALCLFLGTLFHTIADAQAGVVAASQLDNPPGFVESDYDWYYRGYQTGPTGGVEGRLVRRLTDGKTISLPHVTFTVMPATDFTAWLAVRGLVFGKSGWGYPVPAQLKKLYHIFESKDDGSFFASNLPLGTYYLVASAIVVYGRSEMSEQTIKGYDGNGHDADVVVPDLNYPDGQRYAYTYFKIFNVTAEEPATDQLGDIAQLSLLVNGTLNPNPVPAGADSLFDPILIAYPDPPTPSEAELAPYAQSGGGKISGRLNLPLTGIGRLEYKQVSVALLPAVHWSYVWAASLEYNVFNQSTILDWPKWAQGHIRWTRTDDKGRYEFDNLPPGKYVVGSLIDYVDQNTSSNEVREGSITVEHEIGTDVYNVYSNGAEEFDHSEYRTETEEVPVYKTYTSTIVCRIRGSLLAVVNLGSDQSLTTPIADTHWFKDGGGCR
jgi:hypothetical protein